MDIRRVSYPLKTEDYISNPDTEVKQQILAIGDFDGVHLGHQDVIKQAQWIAKEQDCNMALMTFNPHPREVLGQTKYSRYLAPLDKKLDLFYHLGVDTVYIVKFDQQIAKVSPEDFVLHMLSKLHLHTIVVGFDFTFGYKGQGTVDTLRELCKGSIEVKVVKPYHLQGEKVSSTLIREHLHLGQLDQVKQYTDRYYFITGTVVHGAGRGRTIGFPTANILMNEPYVLPCNGVFAVNVIVDEKSLRGVMNIGVRPTFYDEMHAEPSLEVHLIDFDGNLYGKDLKVEFIQMLRAEEKFDSVDELIDQIHKDVEKAKKVY